MITCGGWVHALFEARPFLDKCGLVSRLINFLCLGGAYRHAIAVRIEDSTRSQRCRRRYWTRILFCFTWLTGLNKTWFHSWSQNKCALFDCRNFVDDGIHFNRIYLLLCTLRLLGLLDPVVVLRTFLDYLFVAWLSRRSTKASLRIDLGNLWSFGRVLPGSRWGPWILADCRSIGERNLPQQDVVYLYRWDARAILEAWWRLFGAPASTVNLRMISRDLMRGLLNYCHHEVVLRARVPGDLLNLNWLLFARFQNTSFPRALTRCWRNRHGFRRFWQRVVRFW